MRLWEDLEIKNKRVKPQTFWDTIGNWISSALGDIYRDEPTLESCYAPYREHQYDEDAYHKVLYDYIMAFTRESRPCSPFIIYGPPGIGKTTSPFKVVLITFFC